MAKPRSTVVKSRNGKSKKFVLNLEMIKTSDG